MIVIKYFLSCVSTFSRNVGHNKREVEYIDSDLNGELGIIIKGVGIRVVFFCPKLAYDYGYGSLVIIW